MYAFTCVRGTYSKSHPPFVIIREIGGDGRDTGAGLEEDFVFLVLYRGEKYASIPMGFGAGNGKNLAARLASRNPHGDDGPLSELSYSSPAARAPPTRGDGKRSYRGKYVRVNGRMRTIDVYDAM